MLSPELQEFLRLAPLGMCVGAFGTLVGAGGGSVLVPILLIMFPMETPATITSISMAVVFFNAYAGTVAYMRMGRIDYRAGTAFTVAGLPGAVLGTMLVHELPRELFDPLFGMLLVAIGLLLAWNPMGSSMQRQVSTDPTVKDRAMLTGCIGSGYIGVLSSLLGIGGGIIHVPFLIRVLKMPAHTATATSHFVLTFIALAATITHGMMGELNRGLAQTMSLAVGVMMGAPLGAMLSSRLQGSMIVRLLALALCLVGARLLARSF